MVRDSRKKTDVRGGDYVGQGTYGCVFSPPVPTNHVYDSGMLGKIMNENDANMEYERIKEFKRVDPKEQYGIYGSPPEKVDPDKFVSGAGGLTQTSKCTLNIYLDEAYQLSQVRAKGVLGDLRYDTNDKSNFANIWEKQNLPNLFRGLIAYHRSGLVHLDVKPENVVFFGSVSAPTKFAFIDFGLSEKLETLKVYSPDTTLHSAYFIYPPLANLLFHKGIGDFYTIKTPDLATMTESLSNKETILFLRSKHEKSFYNSEWYPKLVFDPVQDYHNFIKAYKLSKTDKNVRQRMAIATDIYSLGIVVCYTVFIATGMVYDDNNVKFHHNYGFIPTHTMNALAQALHAMFHFKESSLTKLLRSILSRV